MSARVRSVWADYIIGNIHAYPNLRWTLQQTLPKENQDHMNGKARSSNSLIYTFKKEIQLKKIIKNPIITYTFDRHSTDTCKLYWSIYLSVFGNSRFTSAKINLHGVTFQIPHSRYVVNKYFLYNFTVNICFRKQISSDRFEYKYTIWYTRFCSIYNQHQQSSQQKINAFINKSDLFLIKVGGNIWVILRKTVIYLYSEKPHLDHDNFFTVKFSGYDVNRRMFGTKKTDLQFILWHHIPNIWQWKSWSSPRWCFLL